MPEIKIGDMLLVEVKCYGGFYERKSVTINETNINKYNEDDIVAIYRKRSKDSSYYDVIWKKE